MLDSLNPTQNVVRIVLDELTHLLGDTDSKLELDQSRTPNVIMLVGLQGSGKTTAASKLAYLLKGQKHHPLLAACDTHRPAAADQLQTLGSEIGVPVYRGDGKDAVKVASESIRAAVDRMCDVVIVDTAGRLQVDEEMMQEAVDIKELMVVDAMTGQDIVNVVSAFAERVDFDGVIMSKLDGDARGGGALSVREVTGKPIKFVSMGEKPDSLEVFHPDRMAKRILGMGDVYGIIEQAEKAADEQSMEDAERMLMQGYDHAMDQIEAIIHSMTKEERAKPRIIDGQRRKRIAKGSGHSIQEVNQLYKQWEQMDKTMGQMRSMMAGGNTKKMGRSMRGMMQRMGASQSDLAQFDAQMAQANQAANREQRRANKRPHKKGKQKKH